MRQLLGSRSLANRNGTDHRARRRVVGQLFSAAALRRYSPLIVALVDEFVAELRCGGMPFRRCKSARFIGIFASFDGVELAIP